MQEFRIKGRNDNAAEQWVSMEIHCLYQDPLEISSSTPLVRATVTQRLEHCDYYRFLQTVYISLVVYKWNIEKDFRHHCGRNRIERSKAQVKADKLGAHDVEFLFNGL